MENITIPQLCSDADYEFVFIVGSGRCGTTALAQLLSSSARIAYTPELKYFSYALSSRKKFEPYDSEDSILRFFTCALRKVLKFNPDLSYKESEILTRFTASLQRSSLIGADSVEVYRAIFVYLVQEFAINLAKKVLLQTPSDLFFHDLIREILGSVKYIFMYRDPRNFFASAMKGNRKWYKNNITAIAQWNLSMQYGERLQEKYSHDCIFITQEDLLLKQSEVITTLAEFLSLESLGKIDNNRNCTTLNPNSSFQNIPLSPITMERYLYTMNEKEIYKVEFLTHKYLKKYYSPKKLYSYKSSSDWRSFVRKFWLYIDYSLEIIKLKILIFLRTKGLATFYFKLKRLVYR
jgi:hypothetical protein